MFKIKKRHVERYLSNAKYLFGITFFGSTKKKSFKRHSHVFLFYFIFGSFRGFIYISALCQKTF